MPDEPELVLFDTMSVLQNFGDRYRYLATRYARRRPHLLALRRPRQAKPSSAVAPTARAPSSSELRTTSLLKRRRPAAAAPPSRLLQGRSPSGIAYPHRLRPRARPVSGPLERLPARCPFSYCSIGTSGSATPFFISRYCPFTSVLLDIHAESPLNIWCGNDATRGQSARRGKPPFPSQRAAFRAHRR